jgi:quercetin dioxygenase-like cupin family protein
MEVTAVAALQLALVAWAQEPGWAQSQNFPSNQGAAKMEIKRNGTQPSMKGPAEWFTGNVRIDSSFQREEPSRVGGGMVTFEPGARTAWHKHPLGQTLIVTNGVGWTQVEGGPILEFYAGDVLFCPADKKHWHGATPANAMTHINIQESLNGSPVTWFEHVTDEQYLAGPAEE